MKLHVLVVLLVILPFVISTISLGEDAAKYWLNKAVEYSSNYTYDNHDLALKCINKSIAINNSDPVAWTRKGIILRNGNESIDCFDKAIKLDPSYIDAWKNKAKEQYQMGLDAYDPIINFNNSSNLFEIIDNDDRQRRILLNESLACYDKILELNPLDVEAWTTKGFVLDELEKHCEAMNCYKTAFIINPEQAEIFWYNKGIDRRNNRNVCVQGVVIDIYIKEEKAKEQIIKDCDRAIDSDKKYAEFWMRYCDVLKGKCNCNGTIECYHNQNGYEIVWNLRGLMLLQLGKPEEANKCFDEAIKLNPGLLEAWGNKGLALKALGRNVEAKAALNKSEGNSGTPSKDLFKYFQSRRGG